MLTAVQGGPKARGDVRLKPDVILFAADDGSARLVDLDGEVYALPDVAAAMLTLTLASGPQSAAVQIARDFGAPLDRVSPDLDALLDDLSRKDLIDMPQRHSRRRRMRHALAATIATPILRGMAHLDLARRGRLIVLLFLARASIALFGFGSSIAAWGGAAIKSRKACGLPQGGLAQIDEAVREASSRLPGLACKERALTCWFALCVLGVPADLIVGFQLFPIGGHAWCEVDGQILTDTYEHCRHYREIARFPAGDQHVRLGAT